MQDQQQQLQYSNFFRRSYTGPPPTATSTWQPSSAFRLPSYEEAAETAEYEDSIRLPTYNGRHLSRFHPYWPTAPRFGQQMNEETKYQNTVFDDQFVPLEVPARVGEPRSTPPLLPYGLAENIVDDDSINETSSEVDAAEHARRLHEFEVERWARIRRLHTAILDFAHTLRSTNNTTNGSRAPGFSLPNNAILHLLDASTQLLPPDATSEEPQEEDFEDSRPQETSDDTNVVDDAEGDIYGTSS